MKRRLVLDTNIIVSAYVTNGPAREFWRHIVSNWLVLMSPEIFAELEEVLRSRDFDFSNEKVAEILKDVLKHVTCVRVHERFEGTLCDLGDIHVAALVVQERPEVLVTGDKPLRGEGKISGVPIMSIREFQEHMKENGGKNESRINQL